MIYPGINNNDDNIRLNTFADMIYNSNLMFNLTGYKTIEDIQKHLVFDSILPFRNINVPRGTLMADMGSGAGIPGIPVSIRLQNSNMTMFDATAKKIEFINTVIGKLGITNAAAVNGRIEEMGRNPEYRGMFDWVITRAMADPYTAAELGSSLTKKEGYLYLYTSEKQGQIDDRILEHIHRLGMIIVGNEEKTSVFNYACDGLLFKKIKDTDLKYPRRISVIKRESCRLNPSEIS